MKITINQLTSLKKNTITLTAYKIFFLLSVVQLILDDVAPYNIIDRNDFAFPKLLIIFTITIFLENIIEILLGIWESIPHSMVDRLVTPCEKDTRLDNVPLELLIAFLLQNNGRPTIEAKEKFGLTTAKHKKLGDNLERVGILTRGENNARVMSKMDHDTIIEIMCRVEDSDLITPILIQDKENTSQYTLSAHHSLATV